MRHTTFARCVGLALAVATAATMWALVAPAVPVAAKDITAVFVTNDNAAPVPTSVVGTPTIKVADAGEPIQSSIVVSSGGTIACETLFEVPAGHRLVVEYINVEAFGLTSTNRPHVRVSGTQIFSAVAVPLTPAFGGTWVGSEMVRLFSHTNLSACAFFSEAQGTFAASVEFRFAGHLYPLS